jgi:hypothetical protein
MRFSPDGTHLLGGVGSSGVYLDGVPIVAPGTGGGWDWLDPSTPMGPAGYSSAAPGFYRYPLPGGPLTYVNALTATSFYANGAGHWLRYLADGHTGSTDSGGRAWPSRVALGFEGPYEIFTDVSGIPLIIRDVGTDTEHSSASPGEWTALPNNAGWFSRNYRSCWYGQNYYACGYLAAYGGLCVWQPVAPGTPVWLLSTALDFNPDIAWRQIDNLLVVGSGQNQGETAQNLYVLDLMHARFNKNGGSWQPLVDASAPTPIPPEPQPPEPEPIPPQPPVVQDSRLLYRWLLGGPMNAVPLVFSPDQITDLGGGKFTVTIANPLTQQYLGFPPPGTTLPGGATGNDCVLSVQPGGHLEVRPKGTTGAYEQATKQGQMLTWKPAAGTAVQLPFAS